MKKKISEALKISYLEVDCAQTEQKLDETRKMNLLPHEMSDSLFTTALGRVMNKFGLPMSYDSDNDHNDFDIKNRIVHEKSLFDEEKDEALYLRSNLLTGTDINSDTAADVSELKMLNRK